MDAVTTLFAANAAMTALAFVGFTLTKSGVAERLTNAVAGMNVAGASGAMIGLASVASVGALFA
jgi:hypothetical protein